MKQYQQMILCFVNYEVSGPSSFFFSVSCNKQKLGYGTLKKGKSTTPEYEGRSLNEIFASLNHNCDLLNQSVYTHASLPT